MTGDALHHTLPLEPKLRLRVGGPTLANQSQKSATPLILRAEALGLSIALTSQTSRCLGYDATWFVSLTGRDIYVDGQGPETGHPFDRISETKRDARAPFPRYHG